ncbi:tandem-95 repeat protein, partial [Pseudomonas sp. BN415]|uniref:cadherin-like domain-containing protein n=1 Tax=Pseudomonas sp. BN415 TaxID=2567889 RepID=UPI0024573C2C
GTPNADVLNGSVVDDAIYGLGSSDTLYGFGGDDLLDGGVGYDYLYGGQGNDTLLAGDDTAGSQLVGEDGDDTLTGSGGGDYLIGGNGNDTLDGGSGNDALDGGSGSNVLQGGDGNDALYVGDGSGLITSNSLDAGTGDDTINVYQSNAGSVTTVSGGSGRDTYMLQPGSTGQMLVSDFAAGASGDILNINQLLTSSSGYSGGNPFDPALGYLRLVQQGADTLLQWDLNGTAAGGNGWKTIITLQNTPASSLTLDNFAPSTSITGIEVVDLNAPPVVSTPLADQAASEDAVFSFTVPAGTFSDPNVGDGLTYSASLADGNPLPGWLSFNAATRTFSGTPGNAEVGSLSIRVTATDSGNLSASDVFTLSIGNTNDAPSVSSPVSLPDGTEDQSYLLTAAQLLANASDLDGDTLSVQSVSVDPAFGSLSDNGDGTWTFSPAANRNGPVSFAVVISDGIATVSTSANLTLAAVNDAPGGSPSTVLPAGSEDTPYVFTSAQLLVGFSDVDGDSLAVANLSASHGSLVDNGDGSWTFTPDANYHGPVSLNYAVVDGQGGSVGASLGFSLTAVNDAPSGSPSTVLPAGSEDTPYVFTSAQLLVGFGDVDGDSLAIANLSANHGSLADNGDGSWTFTPDANYHGPVSLNYAVVDGQGGSVGASLGFSLTAVNDAPSGSPSTVLPAGSEDTPYVFTRAQLLAGFSDVDGDSLAIANLSSSHGSLADNGDGSWTFTPDANYHGSVSLSYAVVDGQGGSISASLGFSLAAVNDAPSLAQALADQNAAEGSPFSFTVAGNAFTDVDGDALSYSASLADGSPLPGWLSFDTATRTFSGTPAAGDIGSLSVRVTATDSGNVNVSDVFTLSIGNTNDAPSVSGPVSLPAGTEDQSYLLTSAQLLANASDLDGDVLSVQSVSVDPAFGSLSDNGDGTWTFSPAANGNGPVSFAVVISDGIATVTTSANLNLAAVNDAPTGNVTLSGTALEGQTLTASHSLFDADGLGVVGYQWQTSADGSSWSDLAGATAASLVLGAALVGLQVRVVARYTDGGGTLESAASSPTAAIAQLLNPIDGTEGDDPLVGTDGADLIHAKGGNDVVQARAGDDSVFGADGDDVLFGEDGNDSLDGGSGYNQLLGGEGNDTLNLGSGALDSSYATGGGGDDLLIAAGLANASAVSLSGDSGSDTYRYDGSGNLSLSDYVNTSQASDFNGLELAVGITPESVTVSGDGNNLTLGFAGGRTLHLSNQLTSWQASDNPNQYGVQEVRFSDGTVWSRQQLRELAGYYIGGDAADDSISTGAGDQFLYGYGGHDSLAGGTDNDRLYGGMGDDLLEGEDGDDILYGEDGNDSLDGGSGYNQLIGGEGNDSLTLGNGAGSSSYAFGGNGDDLLIAVGLASDASVSLSGESGSDTYRYDGSGNLSLSDYVNTSQAGDFNRLELAAGITPASVTVSGDGNGVTLSFVNGKTLYLSNQLASWQASDNPNQYGVQEVLFSDGTVWNRQQLRELAGYYIGGDAADDSIS